jgi:8-oxo-dGTP pyrophosphatase MutT (NUDIX family)
MLSRWKTLSSRVLFSNPWWTYKLDNFQLANGHEGEYHYVHTEGASMVVPFTGEGRVILVNQYRHLCGKESLELPCGGVKPGHSYDDTARIELEEETGFQADAWESVGEFNPYNGVTDEICRVFLAKSLRATSPKPDVTEEFEIVSYSPAEVDSLIHRRVIWDGMTLAAWTMVRPMLMDRQVLP